jgi:hypothetical protein
MANVSDSFELDETEQKWFDYIMQEARDEADSEFGF